MDQLVTESVVLWYIIKVLGWTRGARNSKMATIYRRHFVATVVKILT